MSIKYFYFFPLSQFVILVVSTQDPLIYTGAEQKHLRRLSMFLYKAPSDGQILIKIT